MCCWCGTTFTKKYLDDQAVKYVFWCSTMDMSYYLYLYASHALIYLITFSNTLITDFCIVSRVSYVNHVAIR